MASILLVEPYDTGSHAAWMRGYQRHSQHHVEILSLPGQYWQWRMQGGAVTLARMFMERFAKAFKKPFRGIADSAEQVLTDYPWPGNIRELKNLMERTVLLEKAEVLEAHHLKLSSRPRTNVDSTIGQRVDEALQGVIPTTGLPFEALVEALERALILRASSATKWNQSRTAELLNLKRDKLRYRMKLYDIHPEGQGQTNHPNAA